MKDPTQRFTNRAESYRKYRPHYPPQLLDILRAGCGLTPAWTVADIGSGTGISSELFLQQGNHVYGVEPNAAMRAAAEEQFADNPLFISIDGTAEATALPAAGIDLVIAGQAFHWFDHQQARAEFQRILKPGGWVALFWNDRRLDGTPFQAAFEQMVNDYSEEYAQVSHRNVGEAEISAFFTPSRYVHQTIEHTRWLDYETVHGALHSVSYAPEPGHPAYAPMIDRLERIFADHAQDGKVCIIYDTLIYYGQLEVADE